MATSDHPTDYAILLAIYALRGGAQKFWGSPPREPISVTLLAILYSKVAGMALGKGILCDSVVISYMAKCGEIHQPSIFCNSVVNSDLAISGHPTVHRVLFCAILCHIFSIVPHHVTSCDIVPYLAYCAISFHVVPFHFIFCAMLRHMVLHRAVPPCHPLDPCVAAA